MYYDYWCTAADEASRSESAQPPSDSDLLGSPPAHALVGKKASFNMDVEVVALKLNSTETQAASVLLTLVASLELTFATSLSSTAQSYESRMVTLLGTPPGDPPSHCQM